MELELSGKVALVTGSTLGIGFAIAQELVREGATVYINGRSPERVREAIDKLKKNAKGEVRAAPFDLSQKEGAEALLKQVPKVDILVNNLGIYEVKPFEEITDEDWLRFFEINVLSGIRLSRAYFPKMKESQWGRIIFISSESGVHIPAEMIHYGVTKTAQIAVARGLAEITVGTGVTVNSVLPGPTYSEGVEKFVADSAKARNLTVEQVQKEFFTTIRPSSLIKRFASAEEVAALVAFVASPRASAINGAALRVEGGCIQSIL
ncbi:MAG: SDR family NAD(P)-dependent oxidoreductase [Parachlamydia sp.]|nr:SDR family NAD(P)-dependent oxidoreductase [Parachlamydia sp.]